MYKANIVIIIISFFRVDFYVTFYNYKKPIDVNLYNLNLVINTSGQGHKKGSQIKNRVISEKKLIKF